MVRDGALLDYAIWRPGAPDGVGDLYRGRVMARVAAMAGSFRGAGWDRGVPARQRRWRGPARGRHRAGPGHARGAGRQGAAADRAAGALDERSPPARGPGALLELADRYPGRSGADGRQRAGGPTGAGSRRSGSSVAAGLRRRDRGAGRGAGAAGCATCAAASACTFIPRRRWWRSTWTRVARWPSRQGKAASHLAVNLAVLPALARQIRLRNLSGAILVDFAGLAARRRVVARPGPARRAGRGSAAPAAARLHRAGPGRDRRAARASAAARTARRPARRRAGGIASHRGRSGRAPRIGCRRCARRRRSCAALRGRSRGVAGPCAPGGAWLDASLGSPPARDGVEHRGERWLKPWARGRPARSAARPRRRRCGRSAAGGVPMSIWAVG